MDVANRVPTCFNGDMLTNVAGQPSFRISNPHVEAWVSQLGGHLGPITFRLEDRNVRPMHIAPWAEETISEPPIIQVLRGDFFCMPFGGNDTEFEGEKHPVHGETANLKWSLEACSSDSISLSIRTRIRSSSVGKSIHLRKDQTAIYQEHVVSGGSGPISLGHHAMVHFQSEGLLSVSPIGFGQVFPGQFEKPSAGGYTSLKPGSKFDALEKVELANGGFADLSRYPAREGFEDLAIVFAAKGTVLGWSAVVFPEEGYVWYSLKDARVLTGTVLWHSNGGRPYAPWSGRHRKVLGIEEVTSYMHYGVSESVAANDASKEGFETFVELSPYAPTVVRNIIGVAPIPFGFGHVSTIHADRGCLVITDRTGILVTTELDADWVLNGD